MCGCKQDVKNTVWKFGLGGSTSTIVFNDSTYTCIVNHNGMEEEQTGMYQYIHPNVTLIMDGDTLNAFIEGDKLVTKEEFPITFKKQ